MNRKKVLVTGKNGMLAYDFIRTQAEHFHIVGVDRDECDITKLESIHRALDTYRPDVVLNCAAYTRVDDAEDTGANENFLVNAMGPYYLAKAAHERGIGFITISTDYVFDGEKGSPYTPEDTPNPINAYGRAKWLGEKLALQENSRTIVVRTSWLYGGELFDAKRLEKKGVFKNFVTTMLRLSEVHDKIKVVNDQFGRPTNCKDLSVFLASVIQNEDAGKSRLYHFSSPRKELFITWADFAREIFEKHGKATRVIDCSTAEYPTKATRPKKSALL